MCPSVGSFVHWKVKKWDILLSFVDIFTKICGHLLTDLSHTLAKIKLNFFVCVSVSWFIFSLKNWKVGYFVQFSKYLYQNWWTSSHEPVSKIGHNKTFKKLSVSLSVGSLVYFMDNFKYFSSLLIELIKTFNICPSHYFSADGDWWIMMKVTVRVIGLGTIVTWPSCRPLVLFFYFLGEGLVLNLCPESKKKQS